MNKRSILTFILLLCIAALLHSKIKEQHNEALLPKGHPAETVLNRIFSKGNPLISHETMKAAGFTILDPKEDDLLVASHPDLPNYLIKFYYQSHDINEQFYWMRRLEGVRRVENIIRKHGYQDLIEVPKKWIYKQAQGKSILVVEKMQIVDNQQNVNQYQNFLTDELLEALFTTITEGRFYDCVYIDNIPFSTHGTIVFLDTEDYDRKPIRHHYIMQHFSEPMQQKWRLLLTTQSSRAATVFAK